jgi:hypothetical protein
MKPTALEKALRNRIVSLYRGIEDLREPCVNNVFAATLKQVPRKAAAAAFRCESDTHLGAAVRFPIETHHADGPTRSQSHEHERIWVR